MKREDVAHEIERLHRFFEIWFSSPSGALIGEFADCLDEDFFIVSPNGELSDQAMIVDAVVAHRASGTLEIRIENVHLRRAEPELLIATYEEHKNRASESSVIFSTVGLVADSTRPGGFRWIFVHESWRQAPGT